MCVNIIWRESEMGRMSELHRLYQMFENLRLSEATHSFPHVRFPTPQVHNPCILSICWCRQLAANHPDELNLFDKLL